MRKLLSAVLAATMVMSMTACGGSQPAATTAAPAAETKAAETKAEETKAEETKAEETKAEAAPAAEGAVWKIGGIGPITGGAAVYGLSCMNAQQLAVDEINANGGINGYTYMVGHSVGLAAQILCGQLIGAGLAADADRLMKRSWAWVLGFNMGFSLLFYACSNPLVGLFTQSTEIRAIARTLFMIDIVTCAGRSLNHSFNLGLYSAGYAFWPMMVSIVSIWVVQVGVGFALTVSAGLGVTRGIAVTHLWLSKKWAASPSVR